MYVCNIAFNPTITDPQMHPTVSLYALDCPSLMTATCIGMLILT